MDHEVREYYKARKAGHLEDTKLRYLLGYREAIGRRRVLTIAPFLGSLVSSWLFLREWKYGTGDIASMYFSEVTAVTSLGLLIYSIYRFATTTRDVYTLDPIIRRERQKAKEPANDNKKLDPIQANKERLRRAIERGNEEAA